MLMDYTLADDFPDEGLLNLAELHHRITEFNKTHSNANISTKDHVKWILRGYPEQRKYTIEDNEYDDPYVKIISMEQPDGGEIKTIFSVNINGEEKIYTYLAKAILNSTGHIMVVEDDIPNFIYE